MSQSVKCTLVDNDNKSDGQLFYVPHTKSLIGSADYKLDPTHPSGPIFQLQYNGGIQFNLVVPQSSDMRPPSYNIGDKVHVSNNNKDKNNKAEIIDIPTNNSTYYTIKHDNSNNTELLEEKYISI